MHMVLNGEEDVPKENKKKNEKWVETTRHIQLLKSSISRKEIQSKSSRNFTIIKITSPNLLLGSDFLFSRHKLLMSFGEGTFKITTMFGVN